MASQRFWVALSVSDRVLVQEAMREALVFGNQIADTQNDKALAALRGFAGTRIHTLTAAQIARLRVVVQGVHQGLAQRIGAQWLEEAHKALAQFSG